jgi:hypothetical protein
MLPSLFPEGVDRLDKLVSQHKTHYLRRPAQVHWTHVHALDSSKSDGASTAQCRRPQRHRQAGLQSWSGRQRRRAEKSTFASAFKHEAAKLGLSVVEETITIGQAKGTGPAN